MDFDMLINIFATTIILTFVALVFESWRLKKARQAILHRIHVNGTRGKSSVTRLIYEVLSQSMPTTAKITGSKPVYIDPNGTENPVIRISSANIREQIKYLIKSKKDQAKAVIFECMALHPNYQNVCEKSIIKSTVGVITNGRPDHLDVMGPTVQDLVRSLSMTIPYEGVLITAENENIDIIRGICKKRNTRLIHVNPEKTEE